MKKILSLMLVSGAALTVSACAALNPAERAQLDSALKSAERAEAKADAALRAANISDEKAARMFNAGLRK